MSREPKFTPEGMRAVANDVFFSSDGTRIARVHFNEDTITEDEARAYAAQFAASTAMKEAAYNLSEAGKITAYEWATYNCLTKPTLDTLTAAIASVSEALALCIPLPKGKPFPKPYRQQANPCESRS